MNIQTDSSHEDAPLRTREVPFCPICAHQGTVLHDSVTDRAYGVPGRWQIMCCLHCQSGWLDPVPVPDDLARCYAGDYYTHLPPPPPRLGRSGLTAFVRATILSVQKGYRHLQPDTPFAPLAGFLLGLIPRLRQAASFDVGGMVVPFRRGGNLLEIGCGNGFSLSRMQMLGWAVTGIEPDPVAAELASQATGCRVHVGTIQDAPFEAGSFDAIISSHVIEHVYDPRSFVLSAARLLSKGGSITVHTPNFQSLGHRLLGADLYSLDPPRHLCLFSPTSLHRLFENCGMFARVHTTTSSLGGRGVIEFRHAMRKTGSFFGKIEPSTGIRCAESLFRSVEAFGNVFFHWGEEIRCTAIKA